MDDTAKLMLIGAGAAAVVIYALYKAAGATATAVKENAYLVNPNDGNNIVNQGVTAVGKTLTGNEDFSLGTWIYDQLHPAYDPNAGALQ